MKNGGLLQRENGSVGIEGQEEEEESDPVVGRR